MKKKKTDRGKLEPALKQFDIIAGACQEHGAGIFNIACPFCGAEKAFAIVNDRFSAEGSCAICKQHAHIKKGLTDTRVLYQIE